MKSKGLLIALIISLGINLGAGGTLAYYYIRKANPKLMWKEWGKREDQTWERLGEKLELTTDETEKIRDQFRYGFIETQPVNKEFRLHRDSMIELMKQPELDTARLRELLEREEQLQSKVDLILYSNLYKTKEMLPPEKQAEFIEFVRPSIMFTGKPWYVFVPKKEFYKDTTNKK